MCHGHQASNSLCFQASKKERPAAEDSNSASGSESGSEAESDEEPAQRTTAGQPQVQQADKPTPQQATAGAPVPPLKPVPAAAQPAPVSIRARLEQPAAAAAVAKDADAQPQASSLAADIVIPLVQVTASQPAPVLAPSVSPTLPFDLADLGTLPAPSGADLPYDSADLAASDAAVQQSVFSDSPGNDTDRKDSAGLDADFFAAGTAAAAGATPAEESGMPIAPIGAKANKGMCLCYSACLCHLCF